MTDEAVHSLSRAKIQRLLTAVGSGPPEASAQPQPEVAEYDWRDPHYFTEDQRNRLAAIMSQVAALLSEKFVHFYGAEANVTPIAITQHFGGSLSGQIELERCFCLTFGPDPKHPCGFLTVETETALNWVTRLLGDVEAANDADRTLSPLEESLLSDVIVGVTETFLASLRPQVELRRGDSVVRGRPDTPYEATDEICVLAFELKSADADGASQMRFVLPCRVLDPLIGKTPQVEAKVSPEERERIMMEHLQQMSVTITAKLSSTRLSFEEVLDLGQDDIVLLDKRVHETIDLIIDDQPAFRGRPVQSNGRYAILITHCSAATPPVTATS